MFLIDSHCHLNQLDYENIHKDVSDVLCKAYEKKVKLVLSVSTSILDYYNLIKFVGCRNNVLFSCGVHPVYLEDKAAVDYDVLHNLSVKKNVLAIGETGLDYHHRIDNKQKQQQSFQNHINIAKIANKPIIVHSRCAKQDTIKILQQEEADKCGGILHCFNEDIDTARLLLNLNFYLSFSGMITFLRSHCLQEVIRYVPVNRILLETDAPYLTPIPYRGRENQPAYIYEIAKCIASIRNLTIDQLASYTTDNFYTLFKLDRIKN